MKTPKNKKGGAAIAAGGLDVYLILLYNVLMEI